MTQLDPWTRPARVNPMKKNEKPITNNTHWMFAKRRPYSSQLRMRGSA